VLGLAAKLYLNPTLGYYSDSPDWSEVGNCQDVTLNLEKGDADVTVRQNNGWKATVGTLKDASVDFKMIWDTADENFVSIRNAFLNNEGIEFAVMDGPITTPGSEGLVALMTISKFSRSEPLTEALTVDVTVKPTYSPAHAPSWLVVAA
jgi:hypothetical protein